MIPESKKQLQTHNSKQFPFGRTFEIIGLCALFLPSAGHTMNDYVIRKANTV